MGSVRSEGRSRPPVTRDLPPLLPATPFGYVVPGTGTGQLMGIRGGVRVTTDTMTLIYAFEGRSQEQADGIRESTKAMTDRANVKAE